MARKDDVIGIGIAFGIIAAIGGVFAAVEGRNPLEGGVDAVKAFIMAMGVAIAHLVAGGFIGWLGAKLTHQDEDPWITVGAIVGGILLLATLG